LAPKMFQSKVVIVTGSSAGIGAGTAVQFAREGASGIVLHGRKEDALKEVKTLVEQAGNGKTKVHYVVGDVTDDNVRVKLINDTINQFGKLDILVNNAGIATVGTLSEATIESYDNVFAVNVRSVVALTQLALPHLIKSKGNIVNVSSVAGLMAKKPEFLFYAMSKAALDHFTRCLAVDLGPKGVRVNGINPGYIGDTNMTSRQMTSDKQKEFEEKRGKEHPIGRVGRVEEVADLIIFLASNKAQFITGVNLPIDGAISIS